jgi:hypothetical protein
MEEDEEQNGPFKETERATHLLLSLSQANAKDSEKTAHTHLLQLTYSPSYNFVSLYQSLHCPSSPLSLGILLPSFLFPLAEVIETANRNTSLESFLRGFCWTCMSKYECGAWQTAMLACCFAWQWCIPLVVRFFPAIVYTAVVTFL